jgi:hypothetical protein
MSVDDIDLSITNQGFQTLMDLAKETILSEDYLIKLKN